MKRNVWSIYNFFWLIFFSSDWKRILLRGNQSVCYIYSRTGPWSYMFSVSRMGKPELIYMLVIIGVLFFIFRFWSLTVLLLCWQMRIHDSEPCYRHPNTKADEKHLASISDLSYDSNATLHICTNTRDRTSTCYYSSLHPATVLRDLGCDFWQSFPNQRHGSYFRGQTKPHNANKLFCCNVIKMIFKGPKKDSMTLVIALYISCRHMWGTSPSCEGNRWNS